MVSAIRMLESECEMHTNTTIQCKGVVQVGIQKCKDFNDVGQKDVEVMDDVNKNYIVSETMLTDKKRKQGATNFTVKKAKSNPTQESRLKNGDKTVAVNEKKEKNRVLIIGDEAAKNMAKYLNTFNNVNYVTEGVAMPDVEFSTLAKLIFNYSINYGEKDFVICVFKTFNVSNYNCLKTALRLILPLGRATNLILISQRSYFGDEIIEKCINDRVYRYCRINRNMSIRYLFNVHSIRGILKTIIIKKNPSELNKLQKKIVMRSVQTYNNSIKNLDQINDNDNFFRV